MELIHGVKLKNLPKEDVEVRKSLSKLGFSISVTQVLEKGFFHADPHPGNFLVIDNEILCLVDWGVVGVLPLTIRNDLLEFVEAIVTSDSERTLDILLGFTRSAEISVNERALQRDIMEIITTYHSVSLGRINIGRLFGDINKLMRTHRLTMPTDLAIMFKALVTAEGTARMLNPELNVLDEIKPYVENLVRKRWRFKNIINRLARTVHNVSRLNRNLPKHLYRIIEKIEYGQINIKMHHENLDGLRKTLEKLTNRLAFSIIISSTIIGSSMIITTGVKPLLFGYPVIGITGYIISALIGFWLIFTMFRKK